MPKAYIDPGVDIGKDVQTGIDAILSYFEKKKVKKDIASTVSKAQKAGHQVSYEVDPATGIMTPTIKTKQADPYASMIQEALKSGEFELGSLRKTKDGISPTFKRVEDKTLKIDEKDKAQAIALITKKDELIAQGGQRDVILKTLGGAEYEVDLSDRKSVETGLTLQFGSLWENDSDIVAALDKAYKEIKAVIRYDEGRSLPGSSQAGY